MAHNQVLTRYAISRDSCLNNPASFPQTLNSHMKCVVLTHQQRISFVWVFHPSVIPLFPTPTFKPASFFSPGGLTIPLTSQSISLRIGSLMKQLSNHQNSASSSSLTGTWSLKGGGGGAWPKDSSAL